MCKILQEKIKNFYIFLQHFSIVICFISEDLKKEKIIKQSKKELMTYEKNNYYNTYT